MQHSSQSPINTSASKSLYSFPKSSRFPKPHSPYCDSTYNVPDSFSRRATSIGYGKRFGDLLLKSVAPSPQTYQLPNTRDNKMYSFGVSRDKFDRVYLKENPPRDKSVPGPAAYHAKTNYVETQAAAYSMRPSTTYASMFNDPTKQFPGPGHYEGQMENKNGMCAFSRYKSSGSAVISKTGQRFDMKDLRRSMEMPGPGQYDGFTTFYKTKKNYGATVFGRQKRLEELQSIRKNTPGPGTYRALSEFGYYDPAADALATNTSFMAKRSIMQSARNQ
eukprot:403346688